MSNCLIFPRGTVLVYTKVVNKFKKTKNGTYK